MFYFRGSAGSGPGPGPPTRRRPAPEVPLALEPGVRPAGPSLRNAGLEFALGVPAGLVDQIPLLQLLPHVRPVGFGAAAVEVPLVRRPLERRELGSALFQQRRLPL